MKIQIIGYSGSGKSTLARQLGELLHLPVLHMDATRFYGDWQEYTHAQQEETVRRFLKQNFQCGWVIDGNYSSIATERFSQSDITVFLDFNRFFCYFSAKRRYKKYKGRCREDLPCVEKFDKEFRRWLLWEGRTPSRRKKLKKLLGCTSGRKVVLKNRKQQQKFVLSLVAEHQKSSFAGGKQ